MKTHP